LNLASTEKQLKTKACARKSWVEDADCSPCGETTTICQKQVRGSGKKEHMHQFKFRISQGEGNGRFS
jgi:hypothetical protein